MDPGAVFFLALQGTPICIPVVKSDPVLFPLVHAVDLFSYSIQAVCVEIDAADRIFPVFPGMGIGL